MTNEETEIASALRALFPYVEEPTVMKWAHEIRSSHSVAQSLEILEKTDRDPSKDIQDLKGAAKNLRAAHKKLGLVGHEGGWALLGSSVQADVPAYSRSADGAMKALLDHLEALASSVEDAIERVDPDAPSTNSIFDPVLTERRAATKPRATTARFVALECWDCYSELDGKSASVWTRGGEAYGPFLEFVAQVFDTLGIQASPEAWAREAVRERKEKR